MSDDEGAVDRMSAAAAPELADESGALWDPDAIAPVRRNLLLSAVRCFAANGFDGTTTRDIARGAGLSPAALYVHFPSKELVLHEVVRTGHVRVNEHLRRGLAEEASPVERLHGLMGRYTEWHARHHVAARVAQLELAALAPDHYAEMLQFRHRTSEMFRGTVADGVAQGVFAPDLDVRRVTRAMLSLAIDLVRWYRLDGPDSPEEIARFNADLAVGLVLPR